MVFVSRVLFANLMLLGLLLAACRRGGDPPAAAASAPRAPAVMAGEAPRQATPTSSDVGTISGVVIDAAGRPVSGAGVALVPIGLFDLSGSVFARIESAADGSFRFAGGDGRYGITATAPDAAAWVTDVAAGASGVRLQLVPGGRRLSGRVLDRDRRMRAGVEVRLVRGLGEAGDVFVIQSAADGQWSARVPDGEYHANAMHAGAAAAQVALPTGRDSVDLVLDPVGPPREAPQVVVDWLRRHEVPLASVEPGRGLADLGMVRTIVEDARVVGLGEATHGTREIFQIKHRALEYLVSELGFTVFAIELALPESFAIDDYVLGGPGDPELLLAGQLVAVWQTEELREVVRWMRDWNRTHARKVRFHGLDMRTGVRAAKDLLGYLLRVDRDELGSPVARALAPISDPIAYRDVVRRPKPALAALAKDVGGLVARLHSRRAWYVARSSAEAWWRAAGEAEMLAQLLAWLAAGDTAARVQVRERAMADNLMRALEHHGPDARAVVWAHNAHISGNAEAAPRMMGGHLRAQLGPAYRAFGSVLGGGAYQAVDPASRLLRDFTVPSSGPGSLERTMAAAGHPVALLDLRAALQTAGVAEWFAAFQALRQFDGLYDDERPEGWPSPRAIVAREYDALVFVARGTVARRLPFPRAVHVEPPAPPTPASNLDLEEPDGTRPRAWLWVDARAAVCGYQVALDRARPFAGRASARLARSRTPRYGECAGELRQLVDAAPYRGKRVRVSAAVRVERDGEHAHLHVRSGNRSAVELASGAWRRVAVELDVPSDAPTLELGFAFDGEGAAWLDAVSIGETHQ